MLTSDRSVLIFGAGKSGIAACKLLYKNARKLTLYDGNSELDASDIRKKLPDGFEGEIVIGEMSEELRKNTEVLVISPGVPTDLPIVKEITENGAILLGEIELANMLSKGDLCAITGTNGKTTTTALTGELFAASGRETFVVGNIGIPYTDRCLETCSDSITVAEVSSFQLETIIDMKPHLAAITNITPDHLDRHHTMENYIDCKFRVTMNQDENDYLVLNYEDEIIRERGKSVKAKVIWFSSARELEEGLYLKNGAIYLAEGDKVMKVTDVDDLQIIGRHNYENAMCAIALAYYGGVSLETVRAALPEFKAVEHRIEFTAQKKGVKYYNDSKGTNPDASIQAVRAMTSPTILIGGGYDKGSTYEEWIASFGTTVKELLLMGQTAHKIADACDKAGFKNYCFVSDMEDAVRHAAAIADPGDAVLLSPCCASWGMFKDYEERGRIFKDIVRKLED